MALNINFSVNSVSKLTVIGYYDDGTWSTKFPLSEDSLKKICSFNDFKGKKEESLFIPHFEDGKAYYIVGLGKKDDKHNALFFENLGGQLYAALSKNKFDSVDLAFDFDVLTIAQIAHGMHLRSWVFDEYKTDSSRRFKKAVLQHVHVITQETEQARKEFQTLSSIAEGSFIARDVISQPANVIYPESLAQKARELEKLGVKVELLSKKELEKLGCHAMLGVAQGSTFDPYMVVLHWAGDPANKSNIALVGKGVTFDTGGISIKPRTNMDKMKTDMSGSAVVLGVLKTLALRKAKANVYGVMGLVENMPSGHAQRPGDIVKSMSGQTIEILDTDAEGRLVLADCLWYAKEKLKPSKIIDLATLTGAIVVSLGDEYAGLFSNNTELATDLKKCGEETDELLWDMPLCSYYDKWVDSDVADLRNLGSGEGAGSITAAQFLQRFVGETPWAHLDIAGVAFRKNDRNLHAKGASSFGVRLLNKYIAAYIEK